MPSPHLLRADYLLENAMVWLKKSVVLSVCWRAREFGYVAGILGCAAHISDSFRYTRKSRCVTFGGCSSVRPSKASHISADMPDTPAFEQTVLQSINGLVAQRYLGGASLLPLATHPLLTAPSVRADPGAL